MLKNTPGTRLSPSDGLHKIPICDLQDVVTRALEMQEAQRESRGTFQVQGEEQVRQAVLSTARELGVTEHFLRLAANQVLRERTAEMESRLKRTRKIRRGITGGVLWALFGLAVWWSDSHLGLWPTVTGAALFACAYYYKWRFIDLNNMKQYKPVDILTPGDYIDYVSGKRG